MKTIIYFVLIVTVSVAKDGDVNVYNSRHDYSSNLVAKRQPSPFRFDYHFGEMLSMNIYLTNLVPKMATDMYLKYPSGDIMQKEKLHMIKPEKQFQIQRYLSYSKIFIELELFTTAGLCTTYNIVNAKNVSRGLDTSYNDICLKGEPCVIEVDLLNNICEVSSKLDGPADETTTSTNISTGSDTESKDQQKPNTVLIYGIPSVIGMCVIILGIYISVKKYCHPNSQPIDATELNTHATANEVVYADLSLVQGNSQPPRRDEESIYAKIIAVMRPVPR